MNASILLGRIDRNREDIIMRHHDWNTTPCIEEPCPMVRPLLRTVDACSISNVVAMKPELTSRPDVTPLCEGLFVGAPPRVFVYSSTALGKRRGWPRPDRPQD